MKKRFLALLLAAVSVFQLCGTVLAKEEVAEFPAESIENSEGMDASQFKERGLELLEKGNALIKARDAKILDFNRYYQDDSRWKDARLAEGETMGAYGCAITSFAMVQSYLAGFAGTKKYNPLQLYKKYPTLTYPSLYWDSLAAQFDEMEKWFYSDEIMSYVEVAPYVAGLIEDETPVIIGLKSSTGRTHFVVAYGYAGSAVYIYDPQKSVNKSTLAGYASQFDLGVYKVIAYSNRDLRDSVA